MKKAKRLCALLLTAALSLSLGACSEKPSAAPQGEEPASAAAPASQAGEAKGGEKAELRLSFWFGAEDLPAWQKGIDAYTAEHPGTSIIVESTPWADYWTKLKTQVASDSQADIIGMVSMNSEYFIRNKALLNLAPYAEKDSVTFDDYWPAVMGAYRDEAGGIYCLPYDLSTNVLMCNLDLFEECGVEYKPEGYTMEEFVENCRKLTTDSHKALYWYPDGSWSLYDILLSAGVPVSDESGNLDLSAPETAEIMQWLADLYLKEGVMTRMNRADSEGAFQAGQVAIQGGINPEWVMKFRQRMPDAKLDVMRYPFAGRGGHQITEGGSFAVSSKTKYPEICWDFVHYYTSPEVLGETVGDSHRGIPGCVSGKENMLNSPNAVDHSQVFFDILDEASWFSYPKRTECEVELGRQVDRIFMGEISAADAFGEFMAQLPELQAE